MHVEPARPEEIEPALQLVFQHLAEDQRAARVSNAQSLIASGDLQPQGIHVVRSASNVVGAMIGMALVGAGGLVWLPGVQARQPAGVADDLVDSVCGWLANRGAKVIQAILPRDELERARLLLAHGFSHVTQLQYLRHDFVQAPRHATPIGLRFETYRESIDAEFRHTLQATYEGTLDCPELNGVRTIGEIVEGHKAQGISGPPPWWLIRRWGEPVGVTLLTRLPETSTWDIAYVGVIPSARGSGVGTSMIARAIHEAQLSGADQLTVAVDVRNTPARQLYHQLGFEPTATREVFLCFPRRETSPA